ncbi:DnaD domain protein [Lactobacillus sp. PV037]|uniref:DnaD domain protein n=1 Tax=Lactobacillus sp. PV037 TaxID=2594496 RepID=UPI00224098E2|nr:DnaD domain protein [Lactobacillus sp. PV037]QNQ83586.1 DnaD domain protein [Lactobacillus sp. PV037]
MVSFNNYRTDGFLSIPNVLLKNYIHLNLSELSLLVLLKLEAYYQKNNLFPSNELLAQEMTLSPIQVGEVIQELIDDKVIALRQKKDENGKITSYYDLSPLYTKLDNYLKDHQEVATENLEIKEVQEDPIQVLVHQFEVEFGRLLSPIERQEVAAWINIDHYDNEIIKMALREAVLAQVYNFKYVDRILLNWQQHNLKTPEQVKGFLQRTKF